MAGWVNVAEFTKAKNLEGGLVVRPTSGLPFLLYEGLDVTFVPPVLRMPRHAQVTQIEERSDGSLLVFFEGIDNLNDSQQLLHHYCLVREEDLPEGWDFSFDLDLTGFSVLTEDGEFLGAVVDMLENPAHPLLVVDVQGRETLIPLVEEFICSIDQEQPAITMSLPQGLLEL